MVCMLGVETVRNAISKMKNTDQSTWSEVIVEISIVQISIIDQKVIKVRSERK